VEKPRIQIVILALLVLSTRDSYLPQVTHFIGQYSYVIRGLAQYQSSYAH